MLGELGQRRPSRGVHVHVLFVGDVLLVEVVDEDGLGVVRCAEELDEVVLEVPAVIGDHALRSLGADGLDLSDMALALDVALEAVLVSVLFFAHLAVPS